MRRFFLPAFLVLTAAVAPAWALAPGEIWIVANKNVPDSRVVAEYYCLKRGVPKANVIYLDLPSNDDVGRPAYDANLAKPLRTILGPNRAKVKLILTVYGVPLRVGPTTPTAAEQAELVTLLPKLADAIKQRDAVYAQITALAPKASGDPAIATQVTALKAEYNRLVALVTSLDARKRYLTHVDAVASVDSEIAHLWGTATEFRSYQYSPLYFRVAADQARTYQPAVMTCRLDGPSVAITKGLVDQALAVEARGLTGKAYFDARGLKWDAKADPTGVGYGAYDESVREAALMFAKTSTSIPTKLDDKPEVFAADTCPDCALYCGWYSHAKYVASNKFVPGAVGYHMASSEAISLKRPGSTFWCKRMLDEGIAATIGPVQEPYLHAFPRPAEFFGFLGTGATLAESYWMSNKFVSWMMVVVGDPLYRPFAKAPKWAVTSVRPSPLGVR